MREADLAVGRTAETVDLAFEARKKFREWLAAVSRRDEIVRQLIERPIEIRIEPIVTLIDAHQDLTLLTVVPIERKTGAFADEKSIGAPAGEEIRPQP